MVADEVTINVEAGRGGDGAVSFRREKFVPFGGPDGGDGGKGGDVYIKANPATHTLANFVGRKHFKAESGQSGGRCQRTGKSGEDLYLSVPPGTTIYENGDDKNKIADLVEPNQTIKVARGGRGGWGNIHFATATHQTPREANPGLPGEVKKIILELRLIADVGLIGLPNAGKSTLISRISQARPKIADYPFTTLEPHLGTVQYHDCRFIVADIPGLIEGAAQGKGLGHKFLRHVERTKVLVHLLDATSPDLIKDYSVVRRELASYERPLAGKPEIIVINKVDTIEPRELSKQIKKYESKLKTDIIPISAVSGQGIDILLSKIASKLKSCNMMS